jgi:hypothetical protein
MFSSFPVVAFLLSSVSTAYAKTQSLDSPSVYVGTRGSIAVPANGNGDAITGGLAVGTMLNENNSLGLRTIYMDNPPSNPFTEDSAEIPYAWGPVVDWTYHFYPDRTLNFYTSTSIGYVYGVPTDKKSNNIILPIVEGGLGMRFSKNLRNGNRLYISPELGFVPGATAPYTAISIGMIRPASK